MLLKKTIAYFIIFLLVGLSACSVPAFLVTGGTNPDPAAATAAIQTEVANIVASTEAANTLLANTVASTLTAIVPNTPEFTVTPSFTPTPKPTSIPTYSLTPNSPRMTVSVDTNCRSGPGKVYDVLGVFRVGETAEIVGQDFGKGNWIIRLPSNPAVICWVWRNYATVIGDTGPVPVFTPRPTPTLAIDFILTYDSFTSCGGLFAVKFKIVNNGTVTWESNQVNATDRTTTVSKTINRDYFSNYNGCVLFSNDNNLEPGETGITTSSEFAVNPSGHDFKATVQVCSAEGQGGICIAKTITFIP